MKGTKKFQLICKIYGLSKKKDDLETFQKVCQYSGLSGNLWNCLKKFVKIWTFSNDPDFSGLSGRFPANL